MHRSLTACRVCGWVSYEHLVKARHIPFTRRSVERQICRYRLASLQRTALDTASRDVPVKVVGASLDREIRQTDFERVACSN